eukprot:7379028-Prymnesium_polylepis.1
MMLQPPPLGTLAASPLHLRGPAPPAPPLIAPPRPLAHLQGPSPPPPRLEPRPLATPAAH